MPDQLTERSISQTMSGQGLLCQRRFLLIWSVCMALCFAGMLWNLRFEFCRVRADLATVGFASGQYLEPPVSPQLQPSIAIPCVIHQSWKTSQLPSNRTARWRGTWSRCLPGCRQILWTHADNLALVQTHFPWLLRLYNGLKTGVQRADLARILYLLHHGGIYADLDTICLRDFRPLLSQHSLVFGGMEGHWYRSVNGSYVQNSFMASRPGHPFWIGLLHRIDLRRRKQESSGTEAIAGPLILMEELQQYLDNKFNDVIIYPPSYFNPFSWITYRWPACKTRGAMNESEETACLAEFPDAYVVQLHMKTWAGGKA